MYPKVMEGDARHDEATFTSVPIASSVSSLGKWSTGLCDCFDDFSNCCITCLCPCVVFGQNAEIIDKGNTSCACAGIVYYLLGHFACPSIYSCTYRSKLRGLYLIPGDQCEDFCIHCCCPLCAICQEHRELKNHGLDPSIGWEANAQKQNAQIGMTVAPVIQLNMTRT